MSFSKSISKYILSGASGIFYALALQSSALATQPKIVAVDGILCDLVQTIVRSSAKVKCLIPPGGNPHNYKLKPSDRKFISKANLVLHNGFNLTPSTRKMSSSGNVVAVAEEALLDYSGVDPHVWHDPGNSIAMTGIINKYIIPVVNANERLLIVSRTDEIKSILNDIGRWAEKQFSTVPSGQRVLVTNHQAYSHLAKRYGQEQITMLDSFTTDGVLRPSSLSNISSAIKASGAITIFAESIPHSKTIRRISRRTGLPIYSNQIFAEGIAPRKSTIGTFISNVCTIVNGQGGTCDRRFADQLDQRWSDI